MIETPEFYNYMSGWSNLKQIARVCGKKSNKSTYERVSRIRWAKKSY